MTVDVTDAGDEVWADAPALSARDHLLRKLDRDDAQATFIAFGLLLYETLQEVIQVIRGPQFENEAETLAFFESLPDLGEEDERQTEQQENYPF